jgi:hypothetical protein
MDPTVLGLLWFIAGMIVGALLALAGVWAGTRKEVT